MQAETAVKWLKQVAEEIRAEGHAGWGNTLDDVCAFLAGKVLCGPKKYACDACNGGGIHAGDRCYMCNGYGHLYAPASLTGNADIGKEGA